ncbi:hypothetical protein HFD91_01170 [Enterobacteriaceae bacterium EKM102V]|jgi:hypothetical protein|uniref:hypothetical protein n=1 Tax=Pantoea TaxID=53335 RepID=UPI0002586F3E|nr:MULTISPECIES: hypothetical protein [Pantoea]KAF6662207.1 hypothetical protein HFD91_01170 [Enterobacteriaceae bacterium EKM102V]EIB99613.1 hypothetical protein S7A_13910 [Pantoea sp. Sc1]KAF6664542.1 hypothetical protein HFD92_12135 [Pantoea sp. EKM101V]KAF6670674.1 hypothetical protein HFD97_01170 [Pantoea sp. EKM103V]MDQ1211939.1 hypothetical protein [Pantoea anthophila]
MKVRLASGLLFLLLSFGAFSQQVISESHPHSRSARLLEQGSQVDTADTPDEHLLEGREGRSTLQRRPF